MTIPPADKSNSSRIPSLDGLRAVSILMVLYAHSIHTVNFPVELLRMPSRFVDGKLGVRVFFVISGFLITTLLLREKSKTGSISLVAFYKRRALRILPVYYFYILFVAVIPILGYVTIPTSAFLSAITFTSELWGNWSGLGSRPLAHTWSLAIEEQFYLTWPALLAFLGPKFAARIWIPVLLVLAPCLRFFFWQQPLIDHLFPTQGDSIASGCLLAFLLAYRKPALLKIFQFQPAFCRLAALGAIYFQLLFAVIADRLNLHSPHSDRLFVTVMPSLQCLSICYLIGSLILKPSGVSYWAMNCAPIQWLGRLSYSLYIWQQAFSVGIGTPSFADRWPALSFITKFPLNMLVAFIFALLSYYCLEQPMLKLKTRFTKVPAPR